MKNNDPIIALLGCLVVAVTLVAGLFLVAWVAGMAWHMTEQLFR